VVQLPHPPLWWTSHGNHVNLTEEVRVSFLKSEWICALMGHSLCHMLIPCVSHGFTRLKCILLTFHRECTPVIKVDLASNPHATICTVHHPQDPEYLRLVLYALRQAYERTQLEAFNSKLSLSHSFICAHACAHTNKAQVQNHLIH
jgi:hypothetical protein